MTLVKHRVGFLSCHCDFICSWSQNCSSAIELECGYLSCCATESELDFNLDFNWAVLT